MKLFEYWLYDEDLKAKLKLARMIQHMDHWQTGLKCLSLAAVRSPVAPA